LHRSTSKQWGDSGGVEKIRARESSFIVIAVIRKIGANNTMAVAAAANSHIRRGPRQSASYRLERGNYFCGGHKSRIPAEKSCDLSDSNVEGTG
jgi:hypothetical protein